MEPFLYLIYSNTVALILFSCLISICITALAKKFIKVGQPLSIIFSITVVIYFAFLFLPLPSPLDRQIINMLDQLERNQVDSNATVNTVLFACLDKDQKGVRGLRFQDVIKAYNTDLQTVIEKQGSFDATQAKAKIDSSDLCKAAWYYNGLKNKRLEKTELNKGSSHEQNT